MLYLRLRVSSTCNGTEMMMFNIPNLGNRVATCSASVEKLGIIIIWNGTIYEADEVA